MEENTKDDADYKKRQEAFHSKLLQFHRAHNNPLKRLPLLGGKELDLYHLYLKVKSLGGSKRITQERLWGEVARSFNLPSSVTSASYSCRQNFIKYLEPYERFENGEPVLFPPPAAINTTPLLPPPTRKLLLQPSPVTNQHTALPSSSKNNHLLASKLPQLTAIPAFNNLLKQFDKSPELLGQISAMPSLLQLPPQQLQLVQLLIQQLNSLQGKGSLAGSRIKSDWCLRSLECGLPNEVDLALNSLLIMSLEARVLMIPDSPQLLNILLAHVGIFSTDDFSCLEDLYHEWYPDNELDFVAFWQEVVPEWACLSSLPHHLLKNDSHTMECFPCKSVLTDESIERFRVNQIALIIRNLSFDETNAQHFCKSESLLRFLLLSLFCYLPQIKSYSLDTLVNMAPFLVIETESITGLILTALYSCVLSSDRHSVLRGIEVLGELSCCVYNEEPLSQIPREIFHHMLQFSLLPDYQLVQTSLDSLYSLSFYGGKIGEMILQTDHCIHILLNLLTLNVEKEMGEGSLNGLLIICPDGQEMTANQKIAQKDQPTTSKSNQSSSTQATPITFQTTPLKKVTPTNSHTLPYAQTAAFANSKATPTTVKATPTTVQATPLTINQTTPFINHKTTPTALQTTPLSSRPNSSSSTKSHKNKLSSNRASSNSSISSRGTSSSVHDISKVTFATQWLQSEYVISQEEYIPKLEIYSKYLAHCAQLKYTSAATQTEFEQIFRNIFPSIFSTTVKISGQDIELIGGIGKRTPTTTTIPITNNKIPSPPNSHKSNRGGTTSSTSSVSRSPSPSLSPLQQLIQATKSQSKVSPSPLLQSKKVSSPSSVNNSIKLKRPLVNGTPSLISNNMPLINTSLASTTAALSQEHTPASINKKMAEQAPSIATSKGHSELTNGFNDSIGGLELLKRKLFGVTGKRDRVSENNLTSKKPKNELSEITNKSWSSLINYNNSTESLNNNNILHDERSSSSMQRSNSPSVQRSISPADKRSTSPSLLSSVSTLLHKPVSVTSLSSLQESSTGMESRVTKYICLWNNCQQFSNSYEDLFTHFYYSHVSELTSYPTTCLWVGCTNKFKRMKPSLLRHVQTHHCSSDPTPVPLNVADTLLKLKLVAPLQNEVESCFTRCLRLTVGLIIRNLLEKVPSAHKQLRPYESLLSQVALSNDEASHVAAQCLFLLSSSSSFFHTHSLITD